MSLSDILSVASILISSVAAIVVYVAWNLQLTLDFGEREYVLKLQKELEDGYMKDIREKIKVLNNAVEGSDPEKIVYATSIFFLELNTAKLPERMLKQIKWNFATGTKKFLMLLLGLALIIIYVLSVYNLLPLNFYVQTFAPLVGIIGVLFMFFNANLYSLIKQTIILRNNFLLLSTNRSFEFARDLEKTLISKGCLSPTLPKKD